MTLLAENVKKVTKNENYFSTYYYFYQENISKLKPKYFLINIKYKSKNKNYKEIPKVANNCPKVSCTLHINLLF